MPSMLVAHLDVLAGTDRDVAVHITVLLVNEQVVVAKLSATVDDAVIIAVVPIDHVDKLVCIDAIKHRAV